MVKIVLHILTRRAPAFALAALILAVAAPLPARAGETITIDNAWVRPSIGNLPNSAGYMTIHNGGNGLDRLINISGEIADRIEIHVHSKDGDIMRMRKVSDGVVVPAGGEVSFEPGGFHIMILGVRHKLIAGDHIELKLQFENSGAMTVPFKVGQ